jgi:hypothetical protein
MWLLEDEFQCLGRKEGSYHIGLVWPVCLAQVWTHYKIGKLNMWTLFCNVCILFWTAKYERKSWLNWMVTLQVLSGSRPIFPSKTWFFRIYLNFQRQKSLKNQYFPNSESKSYQVNSIKSCSSRSFQNTKGSFQFLQKSQLWFHSIFTEEIIQYSKTFTWHVQMPWNQASAPLLLQSFPKRSRTQSEASRFSGSCKYKTKQTNYLPS